ncbi:ATP-dependent endonuclease [Thalassospira tepidiphila]|uniref:ATP-dependent nuclease n=1 Tax=Thalassospira tepidiphila TaxID=393657 RepID=UPI001BD14403|nr:AAA family ATPase [Thalassospira tepidiphila]MBS8275599.1 ATP-dependent endonuclease [Thalassospira tepidiphila]
MIIEELRLSNFRCFGQEQTTVRLSDSVTTMIGGNGSGKTAALVALSRLFGINRSQRSVLKTDFHLGKDDGEIADGTMLYIEAVLAFPELGEDGANDPGAVAEFWRQMAATEDGTALKARVRLQASWVEDGTPDGAVVEDMRWITRMDEEYVWEDCPRVSATDRSAVQMIYVPASRNANDQVKALLRGRLWRAAKWSTDLSEAVATNTAAIQEEFSTEEPVEFIKERLQNRWSQVHAADTDTEPVLRLVEGRFESLIGQAEVRFRPDEAGLERELDRLSDGQKSLFQIALTAATLEVEQDAAALEAEDCPFDQSLLRRVPLTILAIEEPENSLSPFFLSRIMQLATDIGQMPTAQVMIASHSSSILSRVTPESIRYFRQDQMTAISNVRALTLPKSESDAGAYVRLAVRAYPELYFARFVVLAEGDSEQLVLPRIAEAQGIALDRSFVPIVPLGGRYVSHFWRLLKDLEIPHATLLDLDLGRQHGGANNLRTIVAALAEVGESMVDTIAASVTETIDVDDLADITDNEFALLEPDADAATLRGDAWIEALREKNVFYSFPIDIDFSMEMAFPSIYRVNNPGGHGPSEKAEQIAKRKKTVLKKNGKPDLYPDDYDLDFVWYSYLFMQTSKPDTHLAAISKIEDDDLSDDCPEELDALLEKISEALEAENQ